MISINTNILFTDTVAEILNTNVNTVRTLAREGKIKAYKRLRKWYFFHEDVEAFIKSSDNGQTREDGTFFPEL